MRVSRPSVLLQTLLYKSPRASDECRRFAIIDQLQKLLRRSRTTLDDDAHIVLA